jgi:hypothetical protein
MILFESGATSARFSYPDYEGYRDRLHSFTGVIAFSIDQLRLTAGGIANWRSAEAGSWMGRLGLLPATANNAEFDSTFIVSENYFSVLGVSALRGRTFESVGLPELAASPSVLVSENYWQRRFSGGPSVLGKSIRLNGAAFTIIGITPHNFIGTSVAAPDFWLPLSLYPLVHSKTNRLRDREDLCCRVVGRLAQGVSMTQAEAETTLLASQLRALHDPHSDLSKDVTALISPGSPFPGKMNAGLRLTILLIMIAVGMVLVIACAKCRQSATGARDQSSAGTGHATIAWGQPAALDSAVVDGKRSGRPAGRLYRDAVNVDPAAYSRNQSRGSSACRIWHVGHQREPRPRNICVCSGDLCFRGHPVRARAGHRKLRLRAPLHSPRRRNFTRS